MDVSARACRNEDPHGRNDKFAWVFFEYCQANSYTSPADLLIEILIFLTFILHNTQAQYRRPLIVQCWIFLKDAYL